MQRGYDITEAVWNDHLLQLIDTLPLEIGERLDNWIDEMKLNAAYSRLDFKELDRRLGKDSTESVSAGRLGD